MLQNILPLIPEHNLYAEPFFGGGAVFFAKEPSPIEVVNDTNKVLMTFYKVAKRKFRKLQRKVQQTLHSRHEHLKAQAIYKYPELFSSVDQAWAVWYLVTTSFASSIGTGMSIDRKGQTSTRKLNSKKESFSSDIQKRLENANLECMDACRLIESRDTPETFFYCDPPYYNADMGHYKGYTEADFEKLLQTLSKIKGKFLLSSYPSELLDKYTRANRWHTKSIRQTMSLQSSKTKTEMLTSNYVLSNE